MIVAKEQQPLALQLGVTTAQPSAAAAAAVTCHTNQLSGAPPLLAKLQQPALQL
jgi:hypothetical protein